MELEEEGGEEEQELFNTNNNTSLTLGGFVIAIPPCEIRASFLSSLKIPVCIITFGKLFENHSMHNYI